jgi:hypothetical protein
LPPAQEASRLIIAIHNIGERILAPDASQARLSRLDGGNERKAKI